MAGTKKTVLVVDDDRDLLDMFEMLFDTSEIEVCLAGNGAEALTYIEQTAPDLVFLDIRMPVMDGRQFARKLRQRHGDKVPIVILTAGCNPELRAREIGTEHYLAKPFELDDLLGQVEYHLGIVPPA